MILSLHSIQLDAPLDQTGELLALTELVLPRNAIARKTALQMIQLKAGKRSFARAPFYEAALLKEKVDGPFGLKVSVTQPLRHPGVSRFFRQLLATGIESSTDLFSTALAFSGRGDLLGDLADASAERLADAVGEDSPAFTAMGGIDLDSETLTAGRVRIPLKLLKSIRKSDQPPGPKAREKRRASTKRFRKGRVVGEITLNLQIR